MIPRPDLPSVIEGVKKMKRSLAVFVMTLALGTGLYAADYAVRPPVVGKTQTVNLGHFSDTFSFTASRGFPAIFRLLSGYYSHRAVNNGRAHYYITHNTAITNAVIVDANGNFAAQLLPIAGTFPTTWEAMVNLPNGDYTLAVTGTVTGSGYSWYNVSMQYRFHELEKKSGWAKGSP